MNPSCSNAWRWYVRILAVVLPVLFSVGLAGHLLPGTAPWMLWLTPFYLLFTGVGVAAPAVAAVLAQGRAPYRDKIHPNDEGQQLLADVLLRELSPLTRAARP